MIVPLKILLKNLIDNYKYLIIGIISLSLIIYIIFLNIKIKKFENEIKNKDKEIYVLKSQIDSRDVYINDLKKSCNDRINDIERSLNSRYKSIIDKLKYENEVLKDAIKKELLQQDFSEVKEIKNIEDKNIKIRIYIKERS